MQTNARELVGVPDAAFMMDETALKELVTIFDRIAVELMSLTLRAAPFDPPGFAENKARLAEMGILFELDMEKFKSFTDRFKKNADLIFQDAKEILRPSGVPIEEMIAARKDEKKLAEMKKVSAEAGTRFASAVESGSVDPEKYLEVCKRATVNMTRMFAIQLRHDENLDAYTIISTELNTLDRADERTPQHDVVKIVLPGLPVPDESVSWQQIIDYRNNPDFQNPFRGVKNWISATARGDLKAFEVEEQLEFLLTQYRRHFEIHQMKTRTTTVQAFVVTTADVVENFTTFRRAHPARTGLSLEHRKVALLEGESTSAGSVVAYVLETKTPVFA